MGQMIEFNLVLKAAGKATSPGMFWRLLGGTVIMLFCGYCGEIQAFPPWPAFIGGLAGWGFILFEIFSGEAGGTAADCSEAVMTSFNYMRLIVTVGWSIYPLGYLFGYLLGAVDEVYLNVTYNVADFVNKIAFVLASGLVQSLILRTREEPCWVEATSQGDDSVQHSS